VKSLYDAILILNIFSLFFSSSSFHHFSFFVLLYFKFSRGRLTLVFTIHRLISGRLGPTSLTLIVCLLSCVVTLAFSLFIFL
jgi:hypothetical protein